MSPVREMDAPGLQANLRREMEYRRLSCRGLAKASGVNKNTISRWSLGYARVRIPTVSRVAAALDLSVEVLLGEHSTLSAGPVGGPQAPDQGPSPPDDDSRDVAHQLAELGGVLRTAADAVTPDLMATLTKAADLAQRAIELDSRPNGGGHP